MEYVYTLILLHIDQVRFCCEENSHVLFGNTLFFVVQHRINNLKSNSHCLKLQTTRNHIDELRIRCDVFVLDRDITVTISSGALMREAWGPCARAWQCVEKSLRRDALAWLPQWSRAFQPKASSAHASASSKWRWTLSFRKIRKTEKLEHSAPKLQKFSKNL